MPEPLSIEFEPLGRRCTASPGQTLLDVARDAGIGLASVCGGVGTCEECRLRLIEGTLTNLSLVEQAALTPADLAAGIRLACQARPLTNVKVEIPPESLTTSQRLQVEGQEVGVVPHSLVDIPGACGLAVDIGTTKLAAYLLRLGTGETLARAGAMNPQVSYGEDVISRIAYVDKDPSGAQKLQSVLMESINCLVEEMAAQAAVPLSSILDAVFVGNTAMHHLASGLPVEQLGRAPFSPASKAPATIPAQKLGLRLGHSAEVYFPPVVAGYVGSDHVAMLLATAAWRSTNNVIALDIGTNTEISLISDGKITCCSCASGPAFEGAHIHEGMRAAAGAIERARWTDGRILWQSIEDRPPVGICGSGILDVVAALQDGRLVKPTGALQNGSIFGVVLVPAAESGLGRDLVVTRKDIHEIQLAKSAIRAGLEALLSHAGLSAGDVDEFIIAGAFGTYLDVHSAVRVGMFPPLSIDRFKQVGNAAGMGAKQMLLSVDKRREAKEIARKIGYVELTSRLDFTGLFIKYLSLEI